MKGTFQSADSRCARCAVMGDACGGGAASCAAREANATTHSGFQSYRRRFAPSH
ncbi:hypothetical protein C7S16_5765 [Burkholderia thailandensis]|uniref:Uncharacterized protein n=1 Tax=Burkholderia thailandensis TaxID=57975 RepID=A0AAW9CNJ0_BURTH|nr:hypothetical protein [Burkholderia thailandensis]MDW9252535.1 hypothetical protein [Burkholderia thailandensis]